MIDWVYHQLVVLGVVYFALLALAYSVHRLTRVPLYG